MLTISPSTRNLHIFISFIHWLSKMCWFLSPRALKSVLSPSSVHTLSNWVLSLLWGLEVMDASPCWGFLCLVSSDCPAQSWLQLSSALFNGICFLPHLWYLPVLCVQSEVQIPYVEVAIVYLQLRCPDGSLCLSLLPHPWVEPTWHHSCSNAHVCYLSGLKLSLLVTYSWVICSYFFSTKLPLTLAIYSRTKDTLFSVHVWCSYVTKSVDSGCGTAVLGACVMLICDPRVLTLGVTFSDRHLLN